MTEADTSRVRDLKLRARYRARRTLDRLDNEPVRRARRMVKALRTDPPSVLYVGDSMLGFVAPYDADQRRLDAMVSDQLGADTSMHVVFGASFNADIIDAYLGLAKAQTHRPIVIVPVWVRGRLTPFVEHPVHGHKRAMRRMRQVNPTGPTWRIRGSWPRPTQKDFDEFYAKPFPSLLGDNLTVGDHVKAIGQAEREGDETARRRALYAYHYGGLVTPAALEAVTQLGRTVRALACPTVVYQTPLPVETGTALLGPEFSEYCIKNLAAIDAAFRLGAGEEFEIIESGTSFSESEFIDPGDGSEHVNERGRKRLADMIVQGVKRATSSPHSDSPV